MSGTKIIEKLSKNDDKSTKLSNINRKTDLLCCKKSDVLLENDTCKPTSTCLAKFFVNDLLTTRSKSDDVQSSNNITKTKNETKLSKLFPIVGAADKVMAVAAALNFGEKILIYKSIYKL